MEVKGSTIAESAAGALTNVTFTLALAIPGSQVDMDSIVINYFDNDEVVMGTSNFTYALSSGSTERGSATMLEGDEQMVVTVAVGTLATVSAPGAYDQFTIQVVPPAGATLTIQKTLPGGLTAVFSLN
jgi:flagellin FlaB